jgi:XTP/dITP diphosphohydrolase
MNISVITSNPGKVREFQRELSHLGLDMEHLPVGYEEIQTDSLEEVVRHGIAELRERGIEDFIIDDSGLFVDALRGFPGVYSAHALRTIGCEGMLRLMSGVEDRGARFECHIGAHIQDVGEILVGGTAHGRLTEEMRGEMGFGFDPIFVPDGERRTYAEIPLEEKNGISHRGRAIRSFAQKLEEMDLR